MQGELTHRVIPFIKRNGVPVTAVTVEASQRMALAADPHSPMDGNGGRAPEVGAGGQASPPGGPPG